MDLTPDRCRLRQISTSWGGRNVRVLVRAVVQIELTAFVGGCIQFLHRGDTQHLKSVRVLVAKRDNFLSKLDHKQQAMQAQPCHLLGNEFVTILVDVL